MITLTPGAWTGIAQILLLALAWLHGDHDGRTHEWNRFMSRSRKRGWHQVGGVMYMIACFAFTATIGWLFIVHCFLCWVAVKHIGYNPYTNKGWNYMGDGEELSERILIFLFKRGLVQMCACLALLLILNVVLFASHFKMIPLITLK